MKARRYVFLRTITKEGKQKFFKEFDIRNGSIENDLIIIKDYYNDIPFITTPLSDNGVSYHFKNGVEILVYDVDPNDEVYYIMPYYGEDVVVALTGPGPKVYNTLEQAVIYLKNLYYKEEEVKLVPGKLSGNWIMIGLSGSWRITRIRKGQKI